MYSTFVETQGHIQFDKLCLGGESIRRTHSTGSRGGKETRTVPFLVFLRVLVVYVQFYFRVQGSCKVAFEERTCNIIVNKFVCFLLNLKLDFNTLA